MRDRTSCYGLEEVWLENPVGMVRGLPEEGFWLLVGAVSLAWPPCYVMLCCAPSSLVFTTVGNN